MIDKQKALQILSSVGEQSELCDVKFFMGDDRNVTQEEMLSEAAKGMDLLNQGKLEPVTSLNKEGFKQVPFGSYA
jgi:hypothetical protein